MNNYKARCKLTCGIRVLRLISEDNQNRQSHSRESCRNTVVMSDL